MSYWAAPLEMGFSLAELLMRRKLCSRVPMAREQQIPKVVDLLLVAARIKQRQK